jgi:hypothetical protein
MKLLFSRQIFEKSITIKFNQNPCSGSRVVPCGRTDGHEADSRFPQFVNAPNNSSYVTEGCTKHICM